MANVVGQTITTRGEVIALAGLTGVVGLGLILTGLHGGGGGGVGTKPLPGGTTLLSAPILGQGTIQPSGQPVPLNGPPLTLPLSASLTILDPQVSYQGGGLNVYTYAWLQQGRTTVFASGVAGIFLPAASSPTLLPLVPPTEPQPGGGTAPNLTLYNFIDAVRAGIALCGGPGVAGPAILYVAIFGRCADDPTETAGGPDCCAGGTPVAPRYVPPGSPQDGFASPSCFTCGPARVPYVVTRGIPVTLVAQ